MASSLHNLTDGTPGVALAFDPPQEQLPDRDGRGSSTLRDATLESVRWVAYGRTIYEVLAFASLVVLAHLIRPAEYGHVAIALILQSLAIVLTGEGFGNPLVQRKLVRTGHLESATLMSVASGLLLGLVAFAAAPLIVTPFFGSRTTHLFQLAAVLFPIYGFIIVPEAILQRRLDLRTVTIVETVGALVGAVLAVGLAVLGLGGTSIILGTIGGALVTAALLLAIVGMPVPRWHRAEAREVTGYGAFASLAGLVYLGVRNVDNVIVGARLGSAQLGLYYRAFALGVNNQLKIGMILLRVAFPALSRSESPEEMRVMRDRMTRLNAAVVVPLLVILAITAPKLVPFVFGSYWKLATAPTQILAFAGIATTLTYCATPFLLASGHPKAVFKFNVATFLVYGGGILVAVSHGLQAVCVAVAITNLLAMLGSYVLMQRLTDVPLRRIWQDSAPAMVSGAALAAVALPLMAALSGRGLPAYVLLAVVGAVGAATYLVTLRFLFRDAFSDLLLIMRSLLPTRRRPHRPSGRETGRAPQRRRLALAVGLPLVAFAIAYGVRTVTVTPLARVVSARAASPQPATKRAGVGELLALAPFHSPASLSVPARPRVSGNAAKSPAVTHTGPTSAPTASGVAPSQASPPPIGFGGGTGPATVTPAPAPPPASGTGVPPSGGTTGSRTGRGAPSSGPASTQSTPARGTGTSSGGG